ncbi:hypothetical protein ACKWTF_015352 [Chironomus riparius]
MSIMLLFYKPTESIKLVCRFDNGAFSHSLLNSPYYCTVGNAKINSRPEAIIDEISGTHKNGYNNENVVAFQISGGTAFYAPKNVEKYFKNLKAIAYQSCQLKEIHQDDLKAFPQLLDLYLTGNQLQVLEQGLFDFNPDLVYVNIGTNKIVQIHSNIFDNLKKLTQIYLSGNTCLSKDATDPSQIKELIQEVSSKCQNSEFLNLESKIKSLQNSIKSLNPQTFKNQIDEIEVEANNSKYAKYFATQVEALKAIKIVEATTTTTHNPTDAVATTLKPCMCEASNQSSCTKVSDLKPILDEIKDLRASGQDQQSSQNDTFLTFEDKIQLIEDSLISFQASTAKRLQTIEDDQKLQEFRISQKIDSVVRKLIAIEDKILEALYNKA